MTVDRDSTSPVRLRRTVAMGMAAALAPLWMAMSSGPARPKEGSFALEATNATAPADAARVISVVPESPLDLTDAETFVLSMNSYGAGGLGVSGYEAIVRICAGDDLIEAQATGYRPNAWNTIAADVSDWPGRSSITKVEVSFRAIGSTQPWGARFQIDQVGWL